MESSIEQHKAEFIDFLLSVDALKTGGDFKLKSGRSSPYFVNVGDFNDGEKLQRLAEAYADTVLHHNLNPDVIFGSAYNSGVPLATATSMVLSSKHGKNVGFAFDRKEEKKHGEATDAEFQRKMLVGARINDNARVVLIDDVFTTGDTKYEALTLLNRCANNLQFPAVLLAVDRQEVSPDGTSAVLKFQQQSDIPVLFLVTAVEIYLHLKTRTDLDQTQVERIMTYLRVFGDDYARDQLQSAGVRSPLEQKIIASERSVIPACDVTSLEQFESLVQQTADNQNIGGYKVGFGLGLRYGLPKVVETARRHTQKPIIYDHQKAGTDIPDTGKDFAKVCEEAGVNAIIIFPQAGPETQRAWMYHALDQGLKVIVGGEMTHPAYKKTEGGYIDDEALGEMYRVAAKAGIADFVVPGNRVERIAHYKKLIEELGVSPIFYSPGLVTQGGDIGEAANAAGTRWHAIVGRSIYEASDMRQAALQHTRLI